MRNLNIELNADSYTFLRYFQALPQQERDECAAEIHERYLDEGRRYKEARKRAMDATASGASVPEPQSHPESA